MFQAIKGMKTVCLKKGGSKLNCQQHSVEYCRSCGNRSLGGRICLQTTCGKLTVTEKRKRECYILDQIHMMKCKLYFCFKSEIITYNSESGIYREREDCINVSLVYHTIASSGLSPLVGMV